MIILLFLTHFVLAQPELICQSQVEMGTDFKICVYAKSEHRLNATQDIQLGFKKLNEINSWMSDWIEGTELNKINRAAGAAKVKISSELFSLLTYSQKISQQTRGSYDPTFNIFWGLYNFKPGEEREPSDEEIRQRLSLIDYRALDLDKKEQTAFLKKPGMKIGLGAIGQGYGVDKIVADLKKKNYSAGYVDGSGDTYFWGKKPDGSLWSIGIRDPFHKEAVLTKIYGTDFAVTTSGDDEKFFVKDGRRIHHIMNPKTGRPAEGMRQVTVIAPTALEADAYDTACFIMGTKDCLSLLSRLKHQAVLIEGSGKIIFTKGLKKNRDKWGEYHTLVRMN